MANPLMRVTMLGTGPSSGVPRVGNSWGQCDPNEPRNRRRRASILAEIGDVSILFDSSPDCRAQLLDAKVDRLDAVVYTHAHADHSHGIDDLRWINWSMKAALPAYGDAATLKTLHERFGYVFEPLRPPPKGQPVRFYKPVLVPREIDGDFDINGVCLKPFEQDHGFSTTLGFRIGNFAYSTDVVRLDEAAFEALAGIDTWIVDAFHRRPHPTHAHLDLTLQWIARVKPRRAVLCHMGTHLDYQALCDELPAGVEAGYDGLVLEVPEIV